MEPSKGQLYTTKDTGLFPNSLKTSVTRFIFVTTPCTKPKTEQTGVCFFAICLTVA